MSAINHIITSCVSYIPLFTIKYRAINTLINRLTYDYPIAYRQAHCHPPDAQEELGSVDQGEPGAKTGPEGAGRSTFGSGLQ